MLVHIVLFYLITIKSNAKLSVFTGLDDPKISETSSPGCYGHKIVLIVD